MRSVREFAPGDTDAAKAFLRELEPAHDRACVDEEVPPDGWRFVFGDEIRHVGEHLNRVTDGQRFRIRAMPRLERRQE